MSEYLKARAKVWGDAQILEVETAVGNARVKMQQTQDSKVWEGMVQLNEESELCVSAVDAKGRRATDFIRLSGVTINERSKRDQDNAIGAWPEHGILGTQLGPNKNGRKW